MYSGYRTERRKFKRLRVNLSILFRVMAPWSILESTQGREFEAKTIDLSGRRDGLNYYSSISPGNKIIL